MKKRQKKKNNTEPYRTRNVRKKLRICIDFYYNYCRKTFNFRKELAYSMCKKCKRKYRELEEIKRCVM